MAYNLRELFKAKAILVEQQGYYSTNSWKDKGIYTFIKGIILKMNIIARPEFELA